MNSTGSKTPPLVAACAALAALLAFPSTPSGSAVVELSPPDERQLQLVEELAQWVGDDAAFQAVAARPVAPVIRRQSRSFELFRQFNGLGHGDLVARLPYGDLIVQAAERHRLDPLLVAAVVEAESGFRATAVSAVGALGLMQLMPDTAARLGAGDPLDPWVNLRLGCRYLRDLLDLYGGDLELALAAYNAGPGNVARFGGVPPFRETRHYVERVLSRYVSHHRRAWQGSEVAELLHTVARGRRQGLAQAALPPSIAPAGAVRAVR